MARFQAGTDGQKAGPALRILAVALLVVAPFAFRGISCGHDFDFHLLSWMEVARAWRSGIWYPHWVQDANYGAGEPRLVFYPPASWVLGGLMGSAVSWTAAPPLFVLLSLLGCGWSMYLLAREWLPEETASLAACLYVANPYMLFVIYERSAFGELLASAWIPLVALFALRKSLSSTSSSAALGVAVAAVWLTNAPAAVLASYMLVILALVMMLTEGNVWPALRAVGGMALGLGLAAFYIVPAAYEQHWIEVSRAILPGLRIQDSFLLKHTGSDLHDQVLRSASWILIFEMAVAGIAAWLASRRHSGSSARIALTFLLPLILFLQFPISERIWNHAPELKFLQFPWRWLLVLSVATCVLVGMALDLPSKAPRNTARKTRLIAPWVTRKAWSAAIVAMVFAGMHLFFQVCDDEDAIAGQVAAFRMDPAAGGVEGTDEYTPSNADNSEIERGLPLVRVLKDPDDGLPGPSQAENPKWSPETGAAVPADVQAKERKAEHWTIVVQSHAPGYAVLRLMDYPAWRVTRNGTIVRDRPRREDGLMAIPILAGSNEIDVHWGNTADVIAGRAISIIALALLLVLSVGDQRDRRRRGSRGEEKRLNPQV